MPKKVALIPMGEVRLFNCPVYLDMTTWPQEDKQAIADGFARIFKRYIDGLEQDRRKLARA